jgi:SAM-dependent methyltransferase
LPIYSAVGQLDNCNFSESTVWEGRLTDGAPFTFDQKKPPGRQFIREASDLHGIEENSYDFILSCHTLEHLANPLKALEEWKRVLRPSGPLFLVLPHKDATFDHRRAVTSLAHLVDDYQRTTKEDDLTHLEEIIALHDLARDPAAPPRPEFDARCRSNMETRCLHHHAFDTRLVAQLLDRAAFQILALEPMLPMHIVALARKLSPGESANNKTFLSDRAKHKKRSPFPTDRNNATL